MSETSTQRMKLEGSNLNHSPSVDADEVAEVEESFGLVPRSVETVNDSTTGQTVGMAVQDLGLSKKPFEA